MKSTRKLYFEDQELLSTSASILEAGEREEDEKPYLVLNQTIFYPQGGGQPWDTGVIESSLGKFKVDEVRMIDDTIYHYGKPEKTLPQAGTEVNLEIDGKRRTRLSGIHTAGHLLDMAMANIGQKQLIPSKGYHFPEGAYVEYEGVLPPESRDQVMRALQEEINRLQQIDMEVSTLFVDQSEVFAYCKRNIDHLRDDEKVRLVLIGGSSACPCGGTHVKQIGELPRIHVYKMKCKSGITRISYTLIS